MTILKAIGAIVGLILTGFGVYMAFFTVNPNTYSGERLYESIVGKVIGIPIGIVGLILLYFALRHLWN